jgi:hemerythrin-like metal-binding protein
MNLSKEGRKKMNWNTSFSVGVEKFDYQHKILIDLINQLLEVMKNGNGKQETSRVIEGLVDYTVFHFGDEEKIMKQFNYPGLISHENEHKLFITKIKDFRNEIRSGKLSVNVQINQFLHDWLLEHIMGEDKKYGVYLNNKGIK